MTTVRAVWVLLCALGLMGSIPVQAGPANPVKPKKSQISIAQGRAALERLNRERLILSRSLGFEDGAMCVAPPPVATTDLDIHRSLLVHDMETLIPGNPGTTRFPLRRTLQKLADDVAATAPGTTPVSIFRQMWDTQNDATSAVTAGNPHCSDHDGKVGAYPLNRCPRNEGQEAVGTDAEVAAHIDAFMPLALVNRLDLAAAGWRNCGEHRIIYGHGATGVSPKNFMIFEAVLPNPKPGCRSGCRDVIEFWVGLSSDSDPASRAAKLEAFFYNGLPGFSPVVQISHYSSGTSSVYGSSGGGQIRTNQFLSGSGFEPGPWTLKEFKTLLSCNGGGCDFDILPINVSTNPYGVLWNKDVANGAAPTPPDANPYATPVANLATRAAAFQNELLAQVTPARLANPDLNSISYEVRPDKNAAESQSELPPLDHYRDQINLATDPGLRMSLQSAGTAHGLSGEQLVNRALANSCAGCHSPDRFGLTAPNAIGPGMSWPDSSGFFHVSNWNKLFSTAEGFDAAHFNGNWSARIISPALQNVFLPARRTTLASLANEPVCNCVRKPGLLSQGQLGEIRDLLDRSKAVVTRDLANIRKATLGKIELKPDDVSRYMAQSKARLAQAETAHNDALKQWGVPFDDRPLTQVTATTLSIDKLEGAALRSAKAAALQKMGTAEPPRQTITGSFRAH